MQLRCIYRAEVESRAHRFCAQIIYGTPSVVLDSHGLSFSYGVAMVGTIAPSSICPLGFYVFTPVVHDGGKVPTCVECKVLEVGPVMVFHLTWLDVFMLARVHTA